MLGVEQSGLDQEFGKTPAVMLGGTDKMILHIGLNTNEASGLFHGPHYAQYMRTIQENCTHTVRTRFYCIFALLVRTIWV
jgi:hypothetical protein